MAKIAIPVQDKLALSADEACSLVGIGRSTMLAFLNRSDRRIPHFKIGVEYRIPRIELERWLVNEAAHQQTG